MTDADIQRTLFDAFRTLNDYSGIEFITDSNVAYPNRAFRPPKDGRWFALSFMADAPTAASVGEYSRNRWSGVFQIDIYTPQDSGEDEAETKYGWLARLFARGSEFGDAVVTGVYRALAESEENRYRTAVRVEWTADIDK